MPAGFAEPERILGSTRRSTAGSPTWPTRAVPATGTPTDPAVSATCRRPGLSGPGILAPPGGQSAR